MSSRESVRALAFAMSCLASLMCFASERTDIASIRVERLVDAPIIYPGMTEEIGTNIQGPSLIRAPAWLENPLGNYYLYFADHKGETIGLAYADDLAGPWHIHPGGSLQLSQTHFPVEAPPISTERLEAVRARWDSLGFNVAKMPLPLEQELTAPHIASPDVHVDDANQRIIMYFHGLKEAANQVTGIALSKDGIHFEVIDTEIPHTYVRAFEHAGQVYALSMPGFFYRSADGLTDFEAGPRLFDISMRHSAVWLNDDVLYVFWSRVGEAPERIHVSTVDVSEPWETWQVAGTREVMRPEREWEGAHLPLIPSMRSVALKPENQLRDPAIYIEDGQLYLLYAVAGESGIGIARLFME